MVDNHSYSSVLLIKSDAIRTNLSPTFTPHLTRRNTLILWDRLTSCSGDTPHNPTHTRAYPAQALTLAPRPRRLEAATAKGVHRLDAVFNPPVPVQAPLSILACAGNSPPTIAPTPALKYFVGACCRAYSCVSG